MSTDTKGIVYMIDKASGGVDFFLWGQTREQAEVSLADMVANGYSADEFEINEATVPADYDGEYRPHTEEHLCAEVVK